MVGANKLVSRFLGPGLNHDVGDIKRTRIMVQNGITWTGRPARISVLTVQPGTQLSTTRRFAAGN